MKSTRNVLAWLILATGLSACSWGSLRQVEVSAQPVERVPLNLAEPTPLKLTPVRWRVVTPENIDQIWKEIESSGNELVLFAVTADGYEQLSLDLADVRSHIAHQRNIIIKYKKYYETPAP